ncbi:metallophosphoesterase family protein [Paenibacillus alginolyticus]|uniref:Metallophosphoesterase n=1 Tax=Paenibacillus alginolyticus TaxID=59839 RepID=A0ABT4GGJ6_9BACL|nr:metallophosphoesterase [Paenibacillus alginolyticus]MCY9695271.1 metallophosphoesterase [Paenibacillus alginolyticus]MEC0144838.1 metallophosphoesterase [Paenibacillus alginolyticus]
MEEFIHVEQQDEKPNIKFVVITDTHVEDKIEGKYSQNFIQALQDIRATSPDSQGIMHIGDMTNNGKQSEFETMAQILKDHKEGLPPFYFTLGNHDVRWADFDTQMSYFTTSTGIDKKYYDFWLSDYHFIFLGTEIGLKDSSYLSETQLEWLDLMLSEHEEAIKPSFIFVHQPLKHTVSGSQNKFGWHGIRQDKELKTILAKHPQTIVFTGHTHWELGSANTMYNSKYATMFNAASTAYLWTDEDVEKAGSQGYFVEVYDHKVVVKGRDFLAKTWIEAAAYSVALPSLIPVVDPKVDPDLTLGNPTMQIDKHAYRTRDLIEVTYTGALREDAFGIFPRGALPSEIKPITPIAHIKTNSVSQPDGKIIFTDLNLPAGSYDIIYLGETLNTELTRISFEVIPED